VKVAFGRIYSMSNENYLSSIAYRESGAAVMSYRVRFGFTDRFAPWGGRKDIIHHWHSISWKDDNPEWDKITTSLGTLYTGAQFLCACYLAPKIANSDNGIVVDITDPDLSKARGLIEAVNDDAPKSFEDRKKLIDAEFYEVFEYTRNYLLQYWKLVDALAQELLKEKKISEQDAFFIIESLIEEKAKRKARRRLRIEGG
jgi:hypothetical protein